jgi:hypothetical protein
LPAGRRRDALAGAGSAKATSARLASMAKQRPLALAKANRAVDACNWGGVADFSGDARKPGCVVPFGRYASVRNHKSGGEWRRVFGDER